MVDSNFILSEVLTYVPKEKQIEFDPYVYDRRFTINRRGDTFLMSYLKYSTQISVELVNKIIGEVGCNINHTNKIGENVLFKACYNPSCNYEIFLMLIEKIKDVN